MKCDSSHIACTFLRLRLWIAHVWLQLQAKACTIAGGVRFTCSYTFVYGFYWSFTYCIGFVFFFDNRLSYAFAHDWGWPPGDLRDVNLGGGGSSLEARWGALGAGARGSRAWEGAPFRLGPRWDALGRAELRGDMLGKSGGLARSSPPS